MLDAPDVAPGPTRPEIASDELTDDPIVVTGEHDTAGEPFEQAAPRVIGPAPLWLLGSIVAIARWWFAQDRIIFHLAPDEAGSLAMSRFLSGGVRWTMFDHATWRPGLATLIAPINVFTSDVPTLMHGTFMVNAALAGIAAAVLARLGLRITNLSPLGCLVGAGVIAVAPASLSATANVWAEALVTLLTLACLWWLLDFYDEPRLGAGLLAVVAMVLGFVSHNRLLPGIPVVVALVVGGLLWRRRFADAVVAAVVSVLATALAFAYGEWIYSHVWDSPGRTNSVGTVVKRLKDPLELLEATLGQLWYQLVATLGVFAFGAVVVIGRSLRRRTTDAPRPRDARVIFALTAPLVFTSIAFMSNRTRTDHLVYGRYNDAIVWPILLIGIGWLCAFVRTAAWWKQVLLVVTTVGAMVGAAVAVDRLHHDAFSKSIGVRPMIAGFMAFVGNRGTLEAIRITVMAAIAFTVVVLALHLCRGTVGRIIGAILLCVALGYAGLRTHDSLALRLNSWAAAGEVVEAAELIPPGEVVGFHFIKEDDKPGVSWNDQRRRAQLYQLYLPGQPMVRDHGIDDEVGPYVFAPTNDPDLESSGAKKLWTDPRVRVSLWRETTDPTP